MISLGIFAFYVLFTNTAAHEPIKWTVATIVLSLTVDEVRQVTVILFITKSQNYFAFVCKSVDEAH